MENSRFLDRLAADGNRGTGGSGPTGVEVRRLAVGGVCGVLLVGLAAACADPGSGPGPPPAAEGPTGWTTDRSGAPPTTGGSVGPTGDALDVHRSGDLGFYASFTVDGDTATRFRDLDEGTRASTVVVVAGVVDVVARGGRPGEPTAVGVVLQPKDIVAGALPAGSGDRLTVELAGTGVNDDEQIAKLKRRLPAQPGLWFLRDAGDAFRTISPQGLFVQGGQHVETPLTTGGDGEMAAEGRDYRRLSALVRQVRGVR